MKTSRIELRLEPDVAMRIRRAAQADRRSISSFITTAAMERAEEILKSGGRSEPAEVVQPSAPKSPAPRKEPEKVRTEPTAVKKSGLHFEWEPEPPAWQYNAFRNYRWNDNGEEEVLDADGSWSPHFTG